MVLQGTMRSVGRIGSGAEILEELGTGERVLRDLTGAAIWTGTQEEVWQLAGTEDRLAFTAHDRSGELVRVTLQAQETALQMQVTPAIAGKGSRFDGRLFSGLTGLRFSY
ncbi:hypothetical protein GCM10011342_28910 [Aquisalinus flavus]|uniref:Uncharacterized protein n=1 Tax=Aquisalinus flavus TaxID=1526572 RepID=A0A8J2Y4E0_9PROT|nr:hypothetical protein [Aquisalinus flavus]MBD0428129.1 hypothetical protein [Aquisalinus flavus]GGD18464.1 hypothetical protein GCM10011342_28910 [Aquisalinus flavus]